MPQCVHVCTYSDVHVTGPDRNQMKEFRCYEAKIEESEKGRQPPGVEPRTPGLSRQCCATELWQPDNHQPSQSYICTEIKYYSMHPCIQSALSLRLQGGTHTCFIDT